MIITIFNKTLKISKTMDEKNYKLIMVMETYFEKKNIYPVFLGVPILWFLEVLFIKNEALTGILFFLWIIFGSALPFVIVFIILPLASFNSLFLEKLMISVEKLLKKFVAKECNNIDKKIFDLGEKIEKYKIETCGVIAAINFVKLLRYCGEQTSLICENGKLKNTNNLLDYTRGMVQEVIHLRKDKDYLLSLLKC